MMDVALKTVDSDGGPAFPLSGNAWRYGMSLRVYFAAKAMEGLLANPTFARTGTENISAFAYQHADRMLDWRQV